MDMIKAFENYIVTPAVMSLNKSDKI